MQTSSLEKKLAEEPIKLPGSPFWDVFKRFGRDEMLAMVLNVSGTALTQYLTNSKFFLSLSGPVFEKAGFFPGHFKEARDIYKTTPKKKREKFSYYFKNAIKGGMTSLIEDIAVHDPMYVLMMYRGMKAYPDAPAFLLSLGSFIAAVFGVAGLEVGVTELAYAAKKRKFKKAGFELEKYYESRFLISREKHPLEVLHGIAKEFDLCEPIRWHYHDRYFKNTLPHYSGRNPRTRLRKRTRLDGKETRQTAQVVYTRATEMPTEKLGQFRYFPIRKEKLVHTLDQKMPETVDDILDGKARNLMIKSKKDNNYEDIVFERAFANNRDTIFVSVDNVDNKDEPFSVVELKTFEKGDMLKEAMRYVLRNFPIVQQTTYGKLDLMDMNGD